MGATYINNKDRYGFDFIGPEYIPSGKDEYYLRNEQAAALFGKEQKDKWIHLTDEQILQLEKNNNFCPDWSKFFVTKNFLPDSIRNSKFYGLVRIGDIGEGLLRYHDFSIPEGIYNSCLISCDIGNHCAIHNCSYISHYIIGNKVLLSKIDEMDTTNHAKAGNGIIKQDESEDVRVWIQPLNEAGGRDVLPFYDMICADAYMWTIYRDDSRLMQALFDLTNKSYDSRRGFYCCIGSGTVIKSCHIIKDVNVEESAYIKGANKLKNLTVKSDESSVTQIGEGVELVNGIIGYGCRIFYGCKAVRFVMGNNSNLKYGARLIHSILGDNSTISCCEVLNNLVFPGHEQHHNNSFLIASLVMGQSNMAAGATVGSNHNSRGNDGEIIAGRGFWPGLSSTLKHNSRFASYTLITKGNYPNELNIPLPFSMLIDNASLGRLEVMPAYYWMYNMYALERNSWKYKTRDNRVHISQHIVTDYLAPDTAMEILNAVLLLEKWVGQAVFASKNEKCPDSEQEVMRVGRKYLLNRTDTVKELSVTGENMERSKRSVHIIKPAEAYHAYRQMLVMYAVKALLTYFEESGSFFKDFAVANADKANALHWINMGGQLMPEEKFNILRNRICAGEFENWKQVHTVYDEYWKQYTFDNAISGLYVLKFVYNEKTLSESVWKKALSESLEIRKYIEDQVYKTKLKDYTNIFRSCTYRNKEEFSAVLGKVESNSFIKTARQDTVDFERLVKKY